MTRDNKFPRIVPNRAPKDYKQRQPQPEALPDLGACCICETTGTTVRNLVMMGVRAPVAGTGWGCETCHIPNDGAVAVVCDACMFGKTPATLKSALKFACLGDIADKARTSIGELTEKFWHNMEYHSN